jgi:hypothetical protein
MQELIKIKHVILKINKFFNIKLFCETQMVLINIVLF